MRGDLPALNKELPVLVLREVAAIQIGGRRRWLEWLTQESHLDLLGDSAPFGPVAGLAGSHEIQPRVFAATVFGHHVVYGQHTSPAATILAGEVIPLIDLLLGEFDARPGAPDHVAQPDDRRARVRGGGGPDHPSAIGD